jgi:hypothetical protein
MVPAPLEQGSKILLLARTFSVDCGTTPEIQQKKKHLKFSKKNNT